MKLDVKIVKNNAKIKTHKNNTKTKTIENWQKKEKEFDFIFLENFDNKNFTRIQIEKSSKSFN